MDEFAYLVSCSPVRSPPSIHERVRVVSQGLFTQTLCILLRQPVSVSAIKQALSEFRILAESESTDGWEVSGPSIWIEAPEGMEGIGVVDSVDQAWPDDMGYEDEDSPVYKAWDNGLFGPLTFPGSLERAAEQSWGWPEGKDVPEKSVSFLRIRMGYGFENDAEETMPEECDPVGELTFLTSICNALLQLPQAICYFNPSGEVLRDRETFEESLQLCSEHEIPTVDLWSNVRLFRFDNDWAMMDTVGNGQLGLPDVEACFAQEEYDLNGVDQLLRMVSMYLVGNEEFEEGEEIEDEAGVTWRMSMHVDSICDPPRPVIRLIPNDGRPLPEELTQDE